jgi:Kef-type K+ transport system membrane component KefB
MLFLALGVGLAADRIGINALVGGFLFGLVVPARPGLAEAVNERMHAAVVYFFLPVFLAVSGLRTDLKLVKPELFGGALLLLALMVAGKWAPGWLVGRRLGLRPHQAHLLGVLLNCRGLLILVVGVIGLQLGVITPAMQAVFVVSAVVTTLMTGPLVDVFVRKAEVHPEADRRVSDVAVQPS